MVTLADEGHVRTLYYPSSSLVNLKLFPSKKVKIKQTNKQKPELIKIPNRRRGFPGSPAVKTLGFQCRFDPQLGN